MNFSGELIDQIVNSVMRELNLRQSRLDLSAPAEPPSPLPLTVSSSVVTEEVLTRLQAAGREILLSPAAVITPTGRDYIRKNGVRLAGSRLPEAGARAASGAGNTPRESQRRRPGMLVTIGQVPVAAAAATANGWAVEITQNEWTAVDLLIRGSAASVAACCGGESSVVACLLNRNPAVRAAVVSRTTDLDSLRTVMNPGIFCLDASAWSFVDVRRLLNSVDRNPATTTTWREPAATLSLPGATP